MSGKVLVLNQDYRALTICNVERAFLLVYLQKAEMISIDKLRTLRSVSSSFSMPSIIKLNSYVNSPKKGVVLSRQNVFKRDSYKCVYCGDARDLTLDHVLPRSRKGGTTWENLVTACKSCNSKKGDHTPEEAKMPLPYKPYKPSFIIFLRDLSGKVDDEWYTYLGNKKKKWLE
jgi:5-methylcytosine-specific restriction endonuclease McrA